MNLPQAKTLDLSVIVPTHNRLSFLPALIASLASQDYQPNLWELIIVVDGSSDGTLKYLDSVTEPTLPNLRVLSQPQSGVAATRNTGVKAARGRAVLFLDDDMIASPSLVREHAQVHLHDPEAVVVGHVSVPAEKRDPWVVWEDSQLERHFTALKKGTRIPGPRDFYTGNCSVSGELFQRIGGFNINLPRTEDVELGYRLADAGAHFFYRPEAHSLHLGLHPFASWLRNARLYGRCDVLLAWDKGHTHLQVELFRWYHLRNALNKALVQVCARWPTLEKLSISGAHLIGRALYKAGARRLSTTCYSAIYNLAYWLSVIESIGKERFWSEIRAQKINKENITTDLKDPQPTKVIVEN